MYSRARFHNRARYGAAGTRGLRRSRRINAAPKRPALYASTQIIVVVALLAAAALVPNASAVTDQPAIDFSAEQFQVTDDPSLRDPVLAQQRLDAANEKANNLELRIVAARNGIDGMIIEARNIDLNSAARAEQLQAVRAKSRTASIAAYVGLVPQLSNVDFFDTQEAADTTYRRALLRQQAERMYELADIYAALAGEADDRVLALTDTIDERYIEVDYMLRDLRKARADQQYAEWAKEISEIHALADESFASSGRPDPSEAEWAKLRFCESNAHGQYKADTGNTFYGAYQFTWETWGTVYGSGNPAHSPPAEQDARARLLYSRRGNQPWPICGRHLP